MKSGDENKKSKKLDFDDFVESLRPREVVGEHLHASAVPTVCVWASERWSGARVIKVFIFVHFWSFSGLGRLSVSIFTLLRFQRCTYELLGWSGARVMKVFIFFTFRASQSSGGCLWASPCFCRPYGVRASFWDGLELELWPFSFLFTCGLVSLNHYLRILKILKKVNIWVSDWNIENFQYSTFILKTWGLKIFNPGLLNLKLEILKIFNIGVSNLRIEKIQYWTSNLKFGDFQYWTFQVENWPFFNIDPPETSMLKFYFNIEVSKVHYWKFSIFSIFQYFKSPLLKIFNLGLWTSKINFFSISLSTPEEAPS